jgi:hypothetical protein
MKETWQHKVRVWWANLKSEWRCHLTGHRWTPNRADDRYEWCPQCRNGRLTELHDLLGRAAASGTVRKRRRQGQP